MGIRSFVGVAWLLFAFTSACGSKSDDGSGSAKPAAGKRVIGTFTCREVKDGACVEPTDSFERTVGEIHMIYTTKDLPKNGDVYLTKWIVEDAGDAAPPNTVVGTFESKVGDVDAGTVSYTVEGQVKPPTKGWPKGLYRVEVLLGDKIVTSANFKIL